MDKVIPRPSGDGLINNPKIQLLKQKYNLHNIPVPSVKLLSKDSSKDISKERPENYNGYNFNYGNTPKNNISNNNIGNNYNYILDTSTNSKYYSVKLVKKFLKSSREPILQAKTQETKILSSYQKFKRKF